MDILFRPRPRRRERRKYNSSTVSGLDPSVMTPRSLNKARSANTARNRQTKRSKSTDKPRPASTDNRATLPPVLVRGRNAVLPIEERTYSNVKRRYNVSLNMPGAEVRLPALPSLQLNWRVASGSLFALLVALLFHLWTSPNFRIELAETRGNQRISSSDINTVLGVGGEWIFSIDPVGMQEQLLKAFPDIKSAAVKVKLTDQVIVDIEERQPVLAWQQGGYLSWVDAEGFAFPPRGEAELVMIDAKDNPPGTVIDPVARTTQFDPKWVDIFHNIAATAPTGVPIVYSAERGLGWVDPNGWEVFFGTDLSNMDQKLLVYEALVNRLQQDGIQPILISVEYVHAPYYRVEP